MPEAVTLCLAQWLPHQTISFSKVLVVASRQHRYDLAHPRRMIRHVWTGDPMTNPAQTPQIFDKLTHWKKPNMNSATKTALITGSGQNIGRCIAHHLAADGFNINVNGSSDQEAVERVASELRAKGGAALVAMGDVGDKAAAERVVKAGLEHFGAIDVLVNNAAIRPHAPFLEINDADWQRVMDVDLNAAVWLSRMVLPQMISNGWGRIISFSGMNAQRGYPGASSVAVAKHAVWGLTKSLAAEFGPVGVTANIISPCTFPGDDPAGAQDPKFVKLLNENPTRRLGTSDDIGAMVSYLCSKNGGFVNGQMLQINGGVVTQY